jgi:hypothetical protein
MVAAESDKKTVANSIVAASTAANGKVAANGSATQTTSPDTADIEQAIVETVAYVDLFDYPLTAAEIHRYLYRQRVPPDTVAIHLGNGGLVPRHLSQVDGYFTLPGREAIIATRRARQRAARRLWPEALRYGRLIAHLPFVRMIAVTGSLAMGNVQKEADIDYLIVTADDHLWVCRAFVIALVRMAAHRQIELCPNYFVSERALLFPEQNLYTAHELAQMVPLFGLPVYDRMRQLNRWSDAFLPNAGGPPTTATSASQIGVTGQIRALGEAVLRLPLGKRFERWERQRKIQKFRRHYENRQESDFSTDRCKGHFDNHQQRTLSRYYSRFSQKSD